MLAKELQVEIKVLARQGKGIREIARMLGCSRKTVRRVLRGTAKDRYGPRQAKAKKLGPYVEYLRDRIEHAKPDRLAATVLLREIRERGYAGGYSQLKELVASLRPPVEREPIVRFETEPGRLMLDGSATVNRSGSVALTWPNAICAMGACWPWT